MLWNRANVPTCFYFVLIECFYLDDVVYNQSCNAASTLDKRRPDLRDELGYIAPPNRKLPPVPGSNYNTCDRIKRGTVLSKMCIRFFSHENRLYFKRFIQLGATIVI